MGIAHDARAAVGHALENVHAGTGELASRKLTLGRPIQKSIEVRSPAFAPGGRLPVASTVDGEGLAPPIEWSGVPAETVSVVLLCEDPDAPFPEPFVHWIVYGIPATTGILTGAAAALWKEGKNSKLATGFTPAAPPIGHGVHHYHFQVFALDVALPLEAGVGRGTLLDKMKGHVIAFGELVGTYERQ